MSEGNPGGLEIHRLERLEPELLELLASYGSESLGSAAPGEWLLPAIARWGLLYVAEDEGEVVGSAQLIRGVRGNEVYMDVLFIRPGYRRRGYGGRLLSGILGRLRARGYSRLSVTLDPHNLEAERLYERAGFREVDFCKDFYGRGRDRRLMTVELGSGRP